MSRNALRHFTPVTLLGATLLVAACSSKDKAPADSTSTSSSSAVTTTSTAMTSTPAADSSANAAPTDPSHYTDANILAKEMAGDSAEVAIAGMAKGLATSPAVKAYADQLVRDHSKGQSEVQALATKLAITPQTPAGDTTAQATAHVTTRLQGLAKGAAFDTAFVNHEIEDHQQDIKDAQAMTGAAQNAQVKALVQKSLPELQKHLDRAQKIAGAKS